ncbi:hypothetical protein EDB81DRAFT_95951 [Dactylonectria macrodidyma]|uniref:Uncharacterized protein n=1 Tax=Dactylonectria macrodidyma TaxID=307937 RepID=A0A9P9IVZ6_9HYPO|nr:hypothetical protein EDB81DRAFT_95951 [Dactylonectria macrodidyma]
MSRISFPRELSLLVLWHPQLEHFSPLHIDEESGVDVLRSYAETIKGKECRHFIIQYLAGSGDNRNYSLTYEYATAFPVQHETLKRNFEGSMIHGEEHVRWVCTEFKDLGVTGGFRYDETRLKEFEIRGETAFPLESQSIFRDAGSIIWVSPLEPFAGAEIEGDYSMLGQFTNFELPGSFERIYGDVSQIPFDLVAGDPDRVALYATRLPSTCNSDSTPLPTNISPDALSSCLRKGSVSQMKLFRYFERIHLPRAAERLHDRFAGDGNYGKKYTRCCLVL